MVSNKLDLLLSDFQPRSSMTTTVTEVTRPKFPVIDVHNHLGDAFGDLFSSWVARPATDLLEIMDASGVQAMIDLDGQFGEKLTRELAHFQEPFPDRFAVFSGVDYDNFATDANFGETEAKRLREAVAKGARGLKVWKTLGLHLRDSSGKLIPIDDERLDPLWQAAGELDVPVLIHIADPVAFFQPLDRFNERWEELHEHPDWHFYPTRPAGSDNSHPDFPTFEELMDQFENMIRRHPSTNFIGAHVGCYAENLHWVGRVMDACPNFHADISARIAELGRQPYTTREFFLAHPDQILFGTDLTPDPAMYQIYYRFAETRDEYFDYGTDPVPSVGRWQIYGLYLPDDVLKKFYFENANRLVFKGALTPAW